MKQPVTQPLLKRNLSSQTPTSLTSSGRLWLSQFSSSLSSFTKFSKLKLFFQKYHQGGPLLLALSGGPDSMFLFFSLLHLNLPFEVAHIHHGTRPESDQEERFLKKLCQELSVPFHSRRLHLPKENFENLAREERLVFFSELMPNFEALVLGHHADDQAETILKRLFEGGSLPTLQGMEPLSQLRGMRLLRPLLSLKKKDFISLAFPYFVDPTNGDSSNLRSKMRVEILPILAQRFGKEITGALTHLAKEAKELNGWLEQEIASIELGGKSLAVKDLLPFPPYLQKFLIRKWLKKHRCTPTKDQMENIGKRLNTKTIEKKFLFKEGLLLMSNQILALKTK